MKTLEEIRSLSFPERAAYLAKLNTLTKFPSIPTLHQIGDKGVLDMIKTNVPPGVETVSVTEKIDGTNTRIIILPDGMIIGSREELLWAHGDTLHNPAMGIVDAIRGSIRLWHMHAVLASRLSIKVLYGETYGHKIGANWKNYTSAESPSVGFRLFDVAEIDRAWIEDSFDSMDLATLSLWRENVENRHRFSTRHAIEATAARIGIGAVPYIGNAALSDFISEYPKAMLARIRGSLALAIANANIVATGEAEGVVLRTECGLRWKARIEDYERTLRKSGK